MRILVVVYNAVRSLFNSSAGDACDSTKEAASDAADAVSDAVDDKTDDTKTQ